MYQLLRTQCFLPSFHFVSTKLGEGACTVDRLCRVPLCRIALQTECVGANNAAAILPGHKCSIITPLPISCPHLFPTTYSFNPQTTTRFCCIISQSICCKDNTLLSFCELLYILHSPSKYRCDVQPCATNYTSYKLEQNSTQKKVLEKRV